MPVPYPAATAWLALAASVLDRTLRQSAERQSVIPLDLQRAVEDCARPRETLPLQQCRLELAEATTCAKEAKDQTFIHSEWVQPAQLGVSSLQLIGALCWLGKRCCRRDAEGGPGPRRRGGGVVA